MLPGCAGRDCARSAHRVSAVFVPHYVSGFLLSPIVHIRWSDVSDSYVKAPRRRTVSFASFKCGTVCIDSGLRQERVRIIVRNTSAAEKLRVYTSAGMSAQGIHDPHAKIQGFATSGHTANQGLDSPVDLEDL